MKLSTLLTELTFYKENLNNFEDDMEVVIQLKERSIPATAAIQISSIWSGIDWDNGRLFIRPSEPLCRERLTRDEIKYKFSTSIDLCKKSKIIYYCPMCDNNVGKDDRYCKHCGQRIERKKDEKSE